MIPADWITQAHAVRIEDEIERRGIKLVGRGDRSGPCPRCGGQDRFSINVRKQVFNCRGCRAAGDVIALVQFLDEIDFGAAIEALIGKRAVDYRPRPAPQPVDRSDVEREREKARWLWQQRRPIAGTAAEVYLRKARGYNSIIPPTLAFLPARNGHEPALIAAFGLCDEPEPGALAIADADVRAVQLVKLRPDGSGKADVEPNKVIIGKGALGSPIVLAPPNDLLGLAITEGLEDALSIHEATGLGAWAAGGAGRMPALVDTVPAYIDCVTVVGHADAAGRRGATELAEHIRARGIAVILKFLGARPAP